MNFLKAKENGTKKIDPEVESFISIHVFNETLFFTTNAGNGLIYNLNGFKFIGKIEYEYEHKKKYLLNKHDKKKQKAYFSFENFEKNNNDIKKSSNGFYIKNFFIDEESDLIIANYSDNSISIFSLSKCIKNKNISLGSKYKRSRMSTKGNLDNYETNQFNLELNGNLSNSIKNYYFYSHFEKITDICWLNNNFKSFVTSSSDQSLMLWNYRGDKWINYYFDLLKIFDKNLNNFENQVKNNDKRLPDIEKKTNIVEKKEKNLKSPIQNVINKVKYFINIIVPHPKRPDLLLAGDNKGNIYQFDCDLKEAPKKFVVGNFSIHSMSFSRNGNYLAIGFCTGNIILVDFNNNCKFCCVVEEFKNDDYEINARIEKNLISSFCHIFNKFTYIENNTNSNSLNQNNFFKNSEIENNTIKIISMNSYKTLRIQLIKKSLLSNNMDNLNNTYKKFNYNNPYNKDNNINIPNNYFNSTIKNYDYNYNLKKIEMHISEDYLIVLFENNNILINRIESNIISGVITLNNQYLEFYDIKCDPSGLYLAVLSDSFANIEFSDFEMMQKKNEENPKITRSSYQESNLNFSPNKIFNGIDKNKSIDFNGDFGYNYYSTKHKNRNKETIIPLSKTEKSQSMISNVNLIKDNIRKRSSIILYEIGTGNFISILKNIFVISNMKFSNDGRFICVTSDSGCVSVWNTSGEIRENIFSVLEEMKINHNFWEHFRINFSLENAEKFNFFQKINKNYKDKDKYNNSFIAVEEEKKKIITTRNYENTSYRSLDLNYENTINNNNNNYRAISRNKLHSNASNLEKISQNSNDTAFIKSSNGRIFSNYPVDGNNQNNFKVKVSNSFNNKNTDLINSKENFPNLLYSSSNLYKKKFQIEEFCNMDNRASNQNSGFYNNETIRRDGNINENLNIHQNSEYNKNLLIDDYKINHSKNSMMANIFPDPEDIDDLVNDNIDNSKNAIPQNTKFNYFKGPDESGSENNFEITKTKGTSADQIEFFDNNILKFEKNFFNKGERNKYFVQKNNKLENFNKSSNNGSFSQDSIDNYLN